MRLVCRSGCVALLVLLASNCRASLVLEDFESGSVPSGWTISENGPSGTSWKVGGATGPPLYPTPHISPHADGGTYFARSGEPNFTEENIGVFTSPAYSVTFSMLQWLSIGWSGSDTESPSGESYFRILDHAFVELDRKDPAQNDGWETATFNLLEIGLAPGATFYFQAVDGRGVDDDPTTPNHSNYAWIGFDNLQLTGVPVAAVPEASTVFIWGLLGVTMLIPTRRCHEIE